MSIKTISAKSILHDAKDNWTAFKEKYCPSGQLCNDIATFGTLFFMVWFMYVAMEPIIRY
mgnify:CR=1 FL=1